MEILKVVGLALAMMAYAVTGSGLLWFGSSTTKQNIGGFMLAFPLFVAVAFVIVSLSTGD